jgi:hypothetical protein
LVLARPQTISVVESRRGLAIAWRFPWIGPAHQSSSPSHALARSPASVNHRGRLPSSALARSPAWDRAPWRIVDRLTPRLARPLNRLVRSGIDRSGSDVEGFQSGSVGSSLSCSATTCCYNGTIPCSFATAPSCCTFSAWCSAVTASAGSVFCRDFLLCSLVRVSLLCAALVGVACVSLPWY